MKLNVVFHVVVILFVALCVSCVSQVEKEKAGIVMHDSTMPEIANNAVIGYTDSGRKVARVTAPLLERYGGDRPYVEMRKGVNAVFYDKKGNEESYLTAAYAISYQSEKQVLLKNNVVVKNNKGEELKTEKLIWDQAKQKIHSDAFVTITKPNEILQGVGFESNQDFTNYRIFEIKAIVYPDQP